MGGAGRGGYTFVRRPAGAARLWQRWPRTESNVSPVCRRLLMPWGRGQFSCASGRGRRWVHGPLELTPPGSCSRLLTYDPLMSFLSPLSLLSLPPPPFILDSGFGQASTSVVSGPSFSASSPLTAATGGCRWWLLRGWSPLAASFTAWPSFTAAARPSARGAWSPRRGRIPTRRQLWWPCSPSLLCRC